jgi:hypothetical protein
MCDRLSHVNESIYMGPVGIFYGASMHVLTSAVAISSSSMREDDKASVILYIGLSLRLGVA